MKWFAPGPLSDDWEIPKGNGPKFLLMYMNQQQREWYGTFYKDLSQKIMLRNMRLLCKDYDDDIIKRAIAYGCRVSEHPFSTLFIKEMIQCLEELRSSPLQRYYQNKFSLTSE